MCMDLTSGFDVTEGAAAPAGDVDVSGGGVAAPVGEALLGQVQAARAMLSGLSGLLARVGSDELPELAAAAAGAVAAACAAQAAVVLEAEDRGVIAESGSSAGAGVGAAVLRGGGSPSVAESGPGVGGDRADL